MIGNLILACLPVWLGYLAGHERLPKTSSDWLFVILVPLILFGLYEYMDYSLRLH